MTTRNNEQGVALVIVLTIVALLTIAVVEFTYSVQLDRHRARNALNALQARFLARSGINLAEAFLARDAEDRYDAFTEDWYLALAEFCNGIELESTTRLRCDVEDESGKININNTRPGRAPGAAQNQGQQRPTPDAYLRDAIEYIMALHNVHVSEIGDQLREHWEQEPLVADGNRNQRVPDFGSLEDFVAQFRIPTSKLPKLRQALTAQPGLSRININTAPAEVLRAVIIGYADAGEDVVKEILERRQDPDAPFQNPAEIGAVMANLDEDRRLAMSHIFDVRSSYFRLQASALTNTDPMGDGTGGIGQTLTVLVRRTRARAPRGGVSQSQDGQDIRWTFRLMDWRKEGGARLFRQRSLDAWDEDDLANGLAEEDDPRFRSK